MNVEDFIFNYLDTGVFDGNYPEEEIILLRAAAAYYQYHYDNVLTADEKDFGGWPPEIDIQVEFGTGGATTGNQGTYKITVPSGDNGASNIPVAGINGSDHSTFLIYDSKMAMVHEVNHAILGLLGIFSPDNNELIIASIASVAHDSIVNGNISSNSTNDQLLQLARSVRNALGLVNEADYGQDLSALAVLYVRIC